MPPCRSDESPTRGSSSASYFILVLKTVMSTTCCEKCGLTSLQMTNTITGTLVEA